MDELIRTERSGNSLRRLGAVLVVILASALGTALRAQDPSFGSLKRDLDRALRSGDSKACAEAIDALTRHAHAETARHLVAKIESTAEHIVSLRLKYVASGRKRAEYQREVARVQPLVNSGKLGRKALEDAEAGVGETTTEMATLSKLITQQEEIQGRLRRAVAWTYDRCDAEMRSRIAGLLKESYARARSPEDRSDLMRALVWVDDPLIRELLGDQLHSPVAAVRVALLDAIEERGGRGAVTLAIAALRDATWQVRASALRILREVGGLAAAKALVDAMEREEGRLSSDAQAALEKITGQDFHDNVHLWRDWLENEGHLLPEPTETANAPPVPEEKATAKAKRSRGHGTGFYGIETRTKHPVYVIDFSGSMGSPLSGGGNGGAAAAETGPARIGGPRKVDGVVTELLKSIESLPSDGSFNVVLFRAEIEVWRNKMQPATRANKEAIREWVLGRSAGGYTNLFGGLERTFAMAGRGSFDKMYRLSADTILLLSDGSPTAGRVQQTAEILREVRAMNHLRRIAIHVVGLGHSINRGFLMALAEQNDGQFVQITR